MVAGSVPSPWGKIVLAATITTPIELGTVPSSVGRTWHSPRPNSCSKTAELGTMPSSARRTWHLEGVSETDSCSVQDGTRSAYGWGVPGVRIGPTRLVGWPHGLSPRPLHHSVRRGHLTPLRNHRCILRRVWSRSRDAAKLDMAERSGGDSARTIVAVRALSDPRRSDIKAGRSMGRCGRRGGVLASRGESGKTTTRVDVVAVATRSQHGSRQCHALIVFLGSPSHLALSLH